MALLGRRGGERMSGYYAVTPTEVFDDFLRGAGRGLGQRNTTGEKLSKTPAEARESRRVPF